MAHSCMNGGPPADILSLICDQLVGDSQTLVRLGRVSRTWRIFSLPFLLKHVDLSCHNNGRIPKGQIVEDDSPPGLDFPLGERVVMADFSDECRPRNLVPRQRAFLRLMTGRPELATHVKALTWTLVWRDFGEEDLLEIDRCTWEVFGRMLNVRSLDLASLHQIGDEPYIRQSPAKLFPAVTELRLVGWMHRGLVKAIVVSLDPAKLRRLTLDYLQHEGAIPSAVHGPGDDPPMPMPEGWTVAHRREMAYGTRHVGVPKELWGRQDEGKAAIFPGHMWFPLRVLRKMPLASLREVRIMLCPFSTRTDERSDYEVFVSTASLIRSVKDTVEVISISLGEDPSLLQPDGHDTDYTKLNRQIWALYPTAEMQGERERQARRLRARRYRLTRGFFSGLSLVLNTEKFPRLTRVELRGFGILERDRGRAYMERPPDFEATRDSLRACLFVDQGLTKTPNLDYRKAFAGYPYSLPDMDEARSGELRTILRGS